MVRPSNTPWTCTIVNPGTLQVLNWVKSQYLLRPDPKLLFPRNRAAPSHTCCIQHRH